MTPPAAPCIADDPLCPCQAGGACVYWRMGTPRTLAELAAPLAAAKQALADRRQAEHDIEHAAMLARYAERRVLSVMNMTPLARLPHNGIPRRHNR